MNLITWIILISWWQVPITLIAYICGHIWYALKHGWKLGNEAQLK